jgi:hypothetical protein
MAAPFPVPDQVAAARWKQRESACHAFEEYDFVHRTEWFCPPDVRVFPVLYMARAGNIALGEHI